jgi:hypothetical protein
MYKFWQKKKNFRLINLSVARNALLFLGLTLQITNHQQNKTLEKQLLCLFLGVFFTVKTYMKIPSVHPENPASTRKPV